MQAYPEQHSPLAKKLLQYPGAAKPTLAAGQAPQQDLADALDNIFNHPNVGPFISKQLIQKLVTSNPSPQYVARVTAVFNNDGTRQARQSRRGGAGDPARRGGATRDASRDDRQGQGTAAASHADLARLRRQGRERPVPRRQRERRASARGRCSRRRCSISSARSTRRPARSRTRASCRPRCRSRPST